jgi:hypothetical protein
MEVSSEKSVAPISIKKSSSAFKLTPLKGDKDKKLSSIPSPILKDSPSQQELISSSSLTLVHKDSGSSMNDKTLAGSPNRFNNKKVKPGYELATYPKAYEFLQTQSYNRKVRNPHDGDE